jgi:WD40 repeat protein
LEKIIPIPTGGGGTPRFLHTLRLWDAANGKLIRQLEGHQGYIVSLAFSPDGKKLASLEGNKTIRMHNVADGKLLHELPPYRSHGEGVTSFGSVVFSPDGKRLASAVSGEALRFRDVETGKECAQLDGHQAEVWSVVVSPDGKFVASSGADGTILWDIANGKERRRRAGERVASLTFFPNGKELLLRGISGVGIWDTNKDEQGRILVRTDNESLVSAALSPDGKLAAVHVLDLVDGNPGPIQLYETETGKRVRSLEEVPNALRAGSIRFSPDEKKVAAVVYAPVGYDDPEIHLWDVASGKRLRKFSVLPRSSQLVGFSADGKTLVSVALPKAGESPRTNAFVLWEVETGKERRRIETGSAELHASAVSADGRWVAWADDQGVHLWELASARRVKTFRGNEGGTYGIAFTPDGKMLVTTGADTTVVIWELPSKE